jgi:hypothetical protein
MRGGRIAAHRERQGEGEKRRVVHPADGRLARDNAEPDGAREKKPVA